MSSRTDQDVTRQLDRLIANHFANSPRTDAEGRPVAAVSASDKFSWAKHSGATLDFVEQRLAALCENATPPDDKNVVPEFRLRRTDQVESL